MWGLRLQGDDTTGTMGGAGGPPLCAVCVLHLCWSHRHAGVLLDEDVFQGKELVDSRPLQALAVGLKACRTATSALEVW